MKSVAITLGAGGDTVTLETIDVFHTKITVGSASATLSNDVFRAVTAVMAMLVEPYQPLGLRNPVCCRDDD